MRSFVLPVLCALALSLAPSLSAGLGPTILINEVDADTPSSDTAEFVELYDGGIGNTSLDGLVLVFFNGSSDTSYAAFDLDGQSTDSNGYFVVGNPGVANVGLTFDPGSGGGLQNGADAVALYSGDATDFPNGTGVTTSNLADALVYDTNDGDDAGLLVLLNASEPQINEDGGGDKDNESNSRFPNGSGGARNTTAYTQCDPTPGAANCVAPPPTVSGICGDPATIISAIQGPGATSPLNGSPNVVIEGVVVGDFQDGLGGFYVQEEDFDRDGDIATSEGIFVFSSIPVEEGDIVRVQGDVLEFGSGRTITEITNVDGVLGCSTGATVTPEILSMPFPNPPEPYLEQFEGMLVEMVQPLAVTEFFNFGRFGEMKLANLGKLPQFTHLNAPSTTGFANQQAQVARNTITLDDGRSGQNLAPLANGYDIDVNALRGGDFTNYLFGILDDRFGLYRIQPVATPTFTQANPRPAAPPAVGGRLKVAAFNVLNFFTTVDAGADICGPSLLECRGADDEGGDGLTPSRTEYERQLAKLILALQELDADIYGLVELENNYDPAFRNGSPNSAAGRIAAELTTAGGTASCNSFSSVEPGVSVGTDAIAVGFVYCTATVKIADGTSVEILDDSDLPGLGLSGPIFTGLNTNRASLAATFEEISSGEQVVIVNNHFKSKGGSPDESGCANDPGIDPNCDQLDGAGAWNDRRLEAANALLAWLATDPTGSGDPDVLLIGDLNSYAQEAPVAALRSAGFTDLAWTLIGPRSYSFVFDGQWGYLDYAMANESLTAQVTGVGEHHINSDEFSLLDYDFSFNPAEWFREDRFRTSDHDPILVGLDLDGAAGPADVPGDLDGDEDVDINDRNVFLAAYGSSTGAGNYNAEADYNNDGRVDIRDYRIWIGLWRAYLSAAAA